MITSWSGKSGVASRIALSALLISAVTSSSPTAAPDGTRAFQHVIALAQDIGPRPIGSESDRRAAEYVRREMQAYGLDVDLQEVPVFKDGDGERRVNSFNVVGRLEGDGPDTLIVGAHHDSVGAFVPGANDDASGLAVLLEVARLTSSRPRRTHYLFISFCCEEEGLYGSKAFVESADLTRVRAMIALELLGRGELLAGPAPEPPEYWAQRAVVDAARRSGVRNIAARPLWTIAPRLMKVDHSADHEPFLRAGVPAFLLMGTYPHWTYHTAEDRAAAVRPRALRRAARLLDALLLDLEREPPDRLNDPHHLPVTLFGRGLVIPTTGLSGIGLVALLGSAMLFLARLRAVLSPRRILETIRAIMVGATATALGVSGAFASEALMELVHGVRLPWSAHHGLHVAQAIAGTIVTGWMGLNLFRRIKPTIEPGPYLAAALLLPLSGVVLGLSGGWPELAAIAGAPAVAFLLSLGVRSIGRKLALGLAGLAPFTLLMNLADYRALVTLGGVEIPGTVLYVGFLAATLPFALFLAHVACFQDCLHSPVWWRLSGPWVGGPAFAAWAVLGIAAGLLPAYDEAHRQLVHVRQTVDLDTGSATAALDSIDVLDGVRLGGGVHGRVDRGALRATLKADPPADRFEFSARSESEPLEEGVAVTSTARFAASEAPHSIAYQFRSRSGFRVPGRDSLLRHEYTFEEMAPPADSERDFRLLLPAGGDLEVKLAATFKTDLLRLEPRGGSRVFVHHATVIGSRRLIGGGSAPGVDVSVD